MDKINEAGLDELAQKLYSETDMQVRPLYPWVVVRRLPRTQQVGSIWLPEKEQNKIVHEGIVLAVWAPSEQHGESALRPGDHVLFHHFAGVALDTSKEGRYRLVKERDWETPMVGGVLACIDHRDDEDTLGRVLLDIINRYTVYPVGYVALNAIRDRFTLIDNAQMSCTLSGK